MDNKKSEQKSHEKEEGVFEKYYEEYNCAQVWEPKLFDSVCRYFKEPILDVGCYNGEKTNYYYQKGFKGIQGCDISTAKIKEAQNNYPDIHFFRHNFETDVLHSKYRTICIYEVIEHVFDTDVFLSNLSNSLFIEGHLILTTPNLCSIVNRGRIAFGDGKCVSGNIDTSHIRFFTKRTITEALEKNGFRVIEIKGYNVRKFLKRIPMPTSFYEGFMIVAQKVWEIERAETAEDNEQ